MLEVCITLKDLSWICAKMFKCFAEDMAIILRSTIIFLHDLIIFLFLWVYFE